MEKNKKINKKIKNVAKSSLEINLKLILNVLLIAILLLGSIYLFTMAKDINVKNKDLLISYKEESNIKYAVSLKPNTYYQTTTLGMNQQYPSALADTINIKMDYKFQTSEESNYKYRYFTTLELVADNKNNTLNNKNNNLLKRTYQLENEQTGFENNSKEFKLEKEYLIDYDDLNTYITNYKNEYNLSLSSYVKVTMYVEVIDNYKDNIINTTRTIEIDIPLLENPFGITTNNPQSKTKSIYQQSNDNTTSVFFIVFATIMFVVGVLLAIQEFRKVIKSDKEQSKYIRKLNKIITPNSEVIVKVKNTINLKNHNIIEVETIEALLDAQNELRIPIAYFETKHNKEGCFVIVNGKEAWRYTLKIGDDI